MSNWTEAEVLARTQANQPANAKALKAKGRARVIGYANKGETAYAAHLGLELRLGEIAYYEYEAITLKLAADVRYTPDFLVMKPDGQIECHEVKGKKTFRRKDGSERVGAFVEEDARLKIAMAAAKFPFKFIMVWPGTNGEWDSKIF